MNKRVTSKDIAKSLNISRGTVDRALHNRTGIDRITKKKILDKAKEMGYKINRFAQSLSRKKPIKIGCIYPTGRGFFHEIESGIMDAYKTLMDFNIQVTLCKIDSFGLGIDAEIEYMNQLIKNDIDGLAISPEHINKIDPYINKIVESGIPVVTFVSDAPESKRMTHISTDEYKNGQISGDLMSMCLNHKGKVIILTGSFSKSDHQKKIKGFKNSIESYNDNEIEIVKIFETLDVEEKAYEYVTYAINKYPDLSGIYINTATCEYACKALLDSGNAGKIALIGTDVLKEIIPFIKNNTMQATIYQDPYNQGFRTVQILFDVITTGKKYDAYEYIKSDIITKHNIDDYRFH